ncbi:MAG TPA: M28 family peptidase [Gemmatimonadaceae bacterium]|nr:M28 family peptidase [Gemmatimonadaceae bacterium]
MTCVAAAARRHLEAIAAVPRAAGGPAEAAARSHCHDTLAALGFQVAEEPFEYSALPGRFGTPAAGVCSIIVLAAVGHLAFHGAPHAALVVLVMAGALMAAIAWWGARWGVLVLPWCRSSGVNLVAKRGTPRLWLVAHLDSKSQPVPILIRVLGVTASILLWLVAAGVLLAQVAGAPVTWLWPWIAIGGVIAGAPVAASLVQARSPGALDNATGVATVLTAAGALPAGTEIGVLLTSAEELGLVGARAWAQRSKPEVAINCDGIDDSGALRFTFTGRRPTRLLEALTGAADREGERSVVRRLPPGLLVDAVALADAGWCAATVSRGTVRTVARIHTPDDDLARVDGSGSDAAAAVIARAVTEWM